MDDGNGVGLNTSIQTAYYFVNCPGKQNSKALSRLSNRSDGQ
ncbi:hypothetical protein [Arthrobacter sp. SO3]|nr:hypothetical protein [Arthrobacter sp. SO3]